MNCSVHGQRWWLHLPRRKFFVWKSEMKNKWSTSYLDYIAKKRPDLPADGWRRGNFPMRWTVTRQWLQRKFHGCGWYYALTLNEVANSMCKYLIFIIITLIPILFIDRSRNDHLIRFIEWLLDNIMLSLHYDSFINGHTKSKTKILMTLSTKNFVAELTIACDTSKEWL